MPYVDGFIVPERVNVAMAEIAGSMREGLLALAVGTGLQVMQVLMEADVTELAGPKGRHDPLRAGGRPHPGRPGEYQLADSRRRGGGRASRPQADHAREPDGAARHHAKEDGLSAAVKSRQTDRNRTTACGRGRTFPRPVATRSPGRH